MTLTPARVQAVVVAYNSRDTLRPCVEPLCRLAWVDVTVVDNALARRLGRRSG